MNPDVTPELTPEPRGEAAPRATDRRSGARRRSAERGAIIGPRWKFLAEASAELDSSLEYQDTLTNVVRLAVPRLADYAAIGLLAEDGSLTWGCSAHRDPSKAALAARLRAYQPQLTAEGHPIAAALRSGQTQTIKAVDDAFLRFVARDDAHL